MSFAVMTDSSANLPGELVKKYDLSVIPFHYYVNGEGFTYVDSESFDAESFYQQIREGLVVNTSLVSPQEYEDFFEKPLSEGKDVLYVGMSSGISGSYNSSRLAAEAMRKKYPSRRIEVLDTLGASLGEGLIVLRAALCRDSGLSLSDTLAQLREHIINMFQVFTVDDLMHLRRTGRLSNLSAVIGTVLRIKPLLKGDPEGKIVAFGKIRSRRKTIEAIAARYDQLVVRPMEQIIGIAQAGCREDAAYLAELLRKNHPPKEILTVQYEPVTGSHVGPGALALFFEGAPGVRETV